MPGSQVSSGAPARAGRSPKSGGRGGLRAALLRPLSERLRFPRAVPLKPPPPRGPEGTHSGAAVPTGECVPSGPPATSGAESRRGSQAPDARLPCERPPARVGLRCRFCPAPGSWLRPPAPPPPGPWIRLPGAGASNKMPFELKEDCFGRSKCNL
nr:TATA box-binding protein-like 1 isoform X3 [Oryctolagus cuniculus]